MTIDRDQVRKCFASYTEDYDAADPKIKLKIDHTYRVAAISDKIARSLDLSEEEVDLAWLIGMLHDIGRFEQLRRYGTFKDAISIDHAKFGVHLLYEENLLQDYIRDETYSVPVSQREKDGLLSDTEQLIKTAIENHNTYRIQNGLDERTEMFCHIIRDADKIDILRVNDEVPTEDIYNVSTEELRNSMITREVMDAFLEHHAVLRDLKKTPADHIAGHCALVFELVFPVSYQIVEKQGYLMKLLSFSSDNPKTVRQFEELKVDMEKYLSRLRNSIELP